MSETTAASEPQPVKKRSRLKGCLILFFGLAGFAGAIQAITDISSSHDDQDPVSQAIAKRDQQRATALAEARYVIRSNLRDPSSAEFSDDFARVKHGTMVACGKVNGKNAFGALAGATRWLVVPEQNLAIIHDFENGRRFTTLWNRYCEGSEDRDAPPPKEFLGVRFGGRVPGSLRPFEGNRSVWIFPKPGERRYGGVPLSDVWFTAEQGKVAGSGATAKGRDAFMQLRHHLFEQFGAPTSDQDPEASAARWLWGKGRMQITLTYDDDRDQTTLSLDTGA